jgi:hypothetical protein
VPKPLKGSANRLTREGSLMPRRYCPVSLELENVRWEAPRERVRTESELRLPSDARKFAQRSELSEKARDACWDALDRLIEHRKLCEECGRRF